MCFVADRFGAAYVSAPGQFPAGRPLYEIDAVLI
jgi:hypothetical protein